MRRFVLSLIIGLAVAVAGAPAQQPTTPSATTPAASSSSTPALPGANANEAPAAPLPYAFAAVFTIVTLLILCMPTRKA
jgi:hypothetical protein